MIRKEQRFYIHHKNNKVDGNLTLAYFISIGGINNEELSFNSSCGFYYLDDRGIISYDKYGYPKGYKEVVMSKGARNIYIRGHLTRYDEIKNYLINLGGKINSPFSFKEYNAFYYIDKGSGLVLCDPTPVEGYTEVFLPKRIKVKNIMDDYWERLKKVFVPENKNDLTKVFECFKKHEKVFTLNYIEQRVIEQTSYSNLAKDIIDILKSK